MARVKNGAVTKARHKKVLKQAKGYFGSKHRLYKTAKEQLMHSGQYAFRDRKQKKRDFRKLWITRINAACRENEISYSRFLELIDENGISSVEYSSDQITIIPKEQPVSGLTVKYYTGYIYDEDVFNKLKSMDGVEINRAIEDTGSSVFNFIIIYVLPFVIFWLLLSFVCLLYTSPSPRDS